MAIFQFKCDGCSSIFEHLVSSLNFSSISCVSCGAFDVSRIEKTYFYPNKNFCPHDKVLDSEKLKSKLGAIIVDSSQQCGGCGTDGAPGKCTTSGAGCGGNCSCKKGACSSPKLTLEI